MTIETTPFDAADYLTTPERMVAFIETYLEDGTSEELRAALETLARVLRKSSTK